MTKESRLWHPLLHLAMNITLSKFSAGQVLHPICLIFRSRKSFMNYFIKEELTQHSFDFPILFNLQYILYNPI